MAMFDVYHDPRASTPLFGGDGNYAGRPRRVLEKRSKSIRRQSAPPRPPRPDLRAWPKDAFETSVIEVSDDADAYDGSLVIRPQAFHLAPKHPQAGRISPPSDNDVSPAGSIATNGAKRASYVPLPTSVPARKVDERPIPIRRVFSFESLRSAASNYSQIPEPKSRAEILSIAPAYEPQDYLDIVMSNPFQREIEEMKPYSSHTYRDETDSEMNALEDASQPSVSRSESLIVPMSRFNSSHQHRHSPPQRPCTPQSSPDGEKSLDEAWEEVKRAIAPKLRIGMPPSPPLSDKEPSPRVSTEHALPPSPPPPPVPVRNPRRVRGGLARAAAALEGPAKRLSPCSSSPTLGASFRLQSEVPPVPRLPPTAIPPVLPAQNMPLQIPAPLPTPVASDCSSDANSVDSPILMRQSGSVRHSHGHYHLSTVPEPLSITPPSATQFSASRSLASDQISPRTRGFHEPPPIAPARSQTMRFRVSHKPKSSDAAIVAPFDASGGMFRTSIWSGERSEQPPQRSQTLRSIAPGESATRLSFLPPARHQHTDSAATSTTAISTSTNETAVAGTNGLQVLASRIPVDEFAPIKVIPLPEKFKPSSNDDYLPRTSNNYAGFCKSKENSSSSGSLTSPLSSSSIDDHALSSHFAASAVMPKSTGRNFSKPAYSKRSSRPAHTLNAHSDYEEVRKGRAYARKSILDPSSLQPFSGSAAPFHSYSSAQVTTHISAAPPPAAAPAKLRKPKKTADLTPAFCAGAWRAQTAQTHKAFTLRTMHLRADLPQATTTHTKITTLKCSKCSFEGALARNPATTTAAFSSAYAPGAPDYAACADRTPHTAHGVVYRWSFLFKSHVACRTVLRKDQRIDPDQEVYACIFCCAQGRGTRCFEGARTLCGHIAKEHAGLKEQDMSRELAARVGVVCAGRKPGRKEDWDVILPSKEVADGLAQVEAWI